MFRSSATDEMRLALHNIINRLENLKNLFNVNEQYPLSRDIDFE